MIHWAFVGIGVLVLLFSIETGESNEPEVLPVPDVAQDNLLPPAHTTKKKKHNHKRKKHTYSATKTEKLLENYAEEGKCNRLNCSSNIKTAKSCLKTKSLRQKHKKCF